MQAQLRRHLRHCDHVLALRPEDRTAIAAANRNTPISRLRLGVNRSVFHPTSSRRDALCAQLNIPAGRLLVLFVGRLDEGKNIYPLIEACHTLIQQGFHPHLIAAGIGPADTAIKAQLGDHATLCGFVAAPDLAALYNAVDVLAIPSEVEIGSLVLIEALACGLPILVSSASGLATLHGPSPALEAVASGAEAWRTALHSLLTQPEHREAMRAAAQTNARDRVADWNAILREDLYPAWEQALASPTHARGQR